MSKLKTGEKINIVTDSYAKYLHSMSIVKETPKAVLFRNLKSIEVWVPKRSLQHLKERDCFTFRGWFKENKTAYNEVEKLFN